MTGRSRRGSVETRSRSFVQDFHALAGAMEWMYFLEMVRLNRAKLSHALSEISPGQRHLIVAISYDDDYEHGPRRVGVGMVTVFGDIVNVKYMVKEGEFDDVGSYSLPMADAIDVIRQHIGTREAMNFARLGAPS